MLKEQITLALVNFAQALVANQTDANSRERIQQATERFLAAYRGQSEVVYRSVNEAKDALRYAVVATLYKTEEEISEIDLLHVAKPDNPWLETAGIFADDPTLLPMLDEIYALRSAEIAGNLEDSVLDSVIEEDFEVPRAA